MSKGFKELMEIARQRGTEKIAIAAAEDMDVLKSIKKAVELGIVEPILVGDKEKIIEIASEINFNLLNFEIIDQKDKIIASQMATKLVSEGNASILMKGLVDTGVIMKAVLNSEYGLRTEKLISHVAVFSLKTYHKLLIVTDAAMNIAPNLEQKKKIIETAVEFAKSLDIDYPKVGVIGAKEKVSDKMEATVHAKELSDMNKRKEISGCIVDGPFALDNAINKEAAAIKNVVSDVAGDADILLMPTIEAGNVLYKALSFLAEAESAGLILGGKAPIVLTSRADNDEAKLNSIVLGALMASKTKNQG